MRPALLLTARARTRAVSGPHTAMSRARGSRSRSDGERELPARITIRKKNGEARTWDTYNGARVLGETDTHLTDEEVTAKFDRACAYARIPNDQRDRARSAWGNLSQFKDVGEAIQTLAKFGQPRPLSA